MNSCEQVAAGCSEVAFVFTKLDGFSVVGVNKPGLKKRKAKPISMSRCHERTYDENQHGQHQSKHKVTKKSGNGMKLASEY